MSEQEPTGRKSLTIVVPVYNEEGHIALLAARLKEVLAGIEESWSVLFVDDGSRDATRARIAELAVTDARFSAIVLSRNFGKEAAQTAGLRHAPGDAVVLMDADLQHPPEMILQFLEAWRRGVKVVLGVRKDRVGESPARLQLGRAFYRMLDRISNTRIPKGATEFVLLDRIALDAFNALGERCRFSRGLFAWIGFPNVVIPFAVGERAQGLTRMRVIRLISLGIDGLVSFSSLPLKVWSYVGVAVSIGAIAYALYNVIETFVFGVDVPGYPSLIVSIMFFAGVQLISLGVIGEYLARVFDEVKARPLFLVAGRIGGLGAQQSER